MGNNMQKLKCDRVIDIEEPLRSKLLDGFENSRNSRLVDMLRTCGVTKDIALYYIVYI